MTRRLPPTVSSTQPFPFHSYHWGLLWRGLRGAVPEGVEYRQGVAVAAVAGDGGAQLPLNFVGGRCASRRCGK